MPSYRMIPSATATEDDSTSIAATAATAANSDTATNVSAANVSLATLASTIAAATLASTIAAATRQKWEHNSVHITDPTDPHKVHPPRFTQDTNHKYAAPKLFATPSFRMISSATATEDSFTSIAAAATAANGDTTTNVGAVANVSPPSTVANAIAHAANDDTSAVESSSSTLDNVAAAPDTVGSSTTSDINIVAAATAADFDASSSTASTTENANSTEEDAATTTRNRKQRYIAEGDISTLPAQSDKIRFDQLRWYSVANLSADAYYDPSDTTQKPLALTIMGYGVPNFPVVQEDDDVQKSISRHKGGMHKITDILPDGVRSKPWLQKEIMRRCIINNVDPEPKPSQWRIQQLVYWLQTNSPPANEHVFILQMWFKLKHKMRDHYMRQSSSAVMWRQMWRQVRLVEAMLHPDLCANYEGRDDEQRPFDTDGDNDHGDEENEQSWNQRKSYYQKVAELHNSTEILRSRCFSKSYGDPFQVQVDLVPPSMDHYLDAEGVRQKTTRMRADFVAIDEWCREGHPVKDFFQGLGTRGKVPGGDATGYAFLAFREEGRLDDFISYNRKDAATETTVVDISGDEAKDETNNTPKKRKNSTAPSRMSNKKTKNAEEDGDGTYSSEGVEEVMTLAERNEIINNVRCQISMVENSILSHRKEVSVFAREYFALKGQVNKGEITMKREKEEYEYFIYARKNYLECKFKIEELMERVKTLTKEVERWEKDFAEAKLRKEIDARSR